MTTSQKTLGLELIGRKVMLTNCKHPWNNNKIVTITNVNYEYDKVMFDTIDNENNSYLVSLKNITRKNGTLNSINS